MVKKIRVRRGTQRKVNPDFVAKELGATRITAPDLPDPAELCPMCGISMVEAKRRRDG